ncbi:unnamed protein product, partial [Menidia menidia]
VLQNLGKDKFPPQSFEQVGTRIAKVLEKNQTSWVLSSMAALYWRVKGQGKRAIDCLRQALNYAPHHMKDVPLISLANIFQNARLWEDALTVARMAVEIAPHFVVNHFTLANVYIAMNQTSWVLSSMAALYWRVKGQGKRAIDCLRQALNYAPHHMKDVPLISLANIFQNARLWEDALTVARMAVEIAPHFVVNHFTLANVYIAMEEFEKAMRWYESTLKLQPEFAPAKDRLRTIQCYLLTKRERKQP